MDYENNVESQFTTIVLNSNGLVIEGESPYSLGARFVSYLSMDCRNEFISAFPFDNPTFLNLSFKNPNLKKKYCYIYKYENLNYTNINIVYLPDLFVKDFDLKDKLVNLVSSFNESYIFINIEEKRISKFISNNIIVEDDVSFEDFLNIEMKYLNVQKEFIIKLRKFFYQLDSSFCNKSINLKVKDNTNHDEWYCLECVRYGSTNLYLGRLKNITEVINIRNNYFLKGLQDPLTKILQKDAVTSQIIDYIDGAPKDPFILTILDIDFFKNINDTYGHFFGDKVIIYIAEILKKVVGNRGILGRIGGDEFLFLIKNVTSRDEIKQIMRKIRYFLDNIVIDSFEFSCTSTEGISQYPIDGVDYETLFKKADKALYRGKIKGRDCHIIYDEKVHGDITNNKSYISLKQETLINKQSSISFVSFILDKFLTCTEIKKTIQEVICDIANFSCLNKVIICFYENNRIDHYMSFGYTNIDNVKAIYKKYSDFLANYYLRFKIDNMFYFNDYKLFFQENKEVHDFYQELEVSSAVQILLTNNEAVKGIISFEMSNEKRVWQRDELMYLSILGKMINVYINKL